ncbi:periplasmic chaperone for outer membrane proteins SurA [Aquabacterium commune]|uniref:Chaperone SurA n=1 Tax=Aquabacterium commune TaxID=70586 RepID=A0A4R6R553_9BURK|nr:peptidylprolyl isomerase [Aquabacterium commune]TDP81003.1 periplasmic chaperone for outer membrane proteins SurA [Aquabacterium commune]
MSSAPFADVRAFRTLSRAVALCLAAAAVVVVATPASAQLRRNDGPSLTPRIPGDRALSKELKIAGVQTTSDYIVAVVNQELITHTEVDKRVSRIQDASAPGTRLPPFEELRRQVLDALIDEKVQISHARVIGLNVGDSELDQAIENVAAQNQLTLSELRQRMAVDGLDYDRYRSSLREQLLLQRLREREVTARIALSEEEVTNFLATDPAAQTETALNLAHILIGVPERATPAQVAQLQAKAEDLQRRVAAGENFAQLVKQHSDDSNTRNDGGAFGMRELSRLPELFVNAAQGLKVGQVAPVVRSNAGFHIVKLLERESSAQATYTQQRARHILLRSTPQGDTATLVNRLNEIRKQIVDGQTSFAQMARQHSEDGSGAKGGELGWASPGQFVPEFEKALLSLQPGQISEPVVSRFGVHLIQLIERREAQLSDAQRREAARSVLRERKFEATYEEWARELRAAAYVEMRDAP